MIVKAISARAIHAISTVCSRSATPRGGRRCSLGVEPANPRSAQSASPSGEGKASVLAERVLAPACRARPKSMFGLGVFLQVLVAEGAEDDAAHSMTVFSNHTRGRLRRTSHPGTRRRPRRAQSAVVLEIDLVAAEYRDVMAHSLRLTITDAAASFPSRFGRPFLQGLERRSPFRLTSITAARRRVKGQRHTDGVARALAGGGSERRAVKRAAACPGVAPRGERRDVRGFPTLSRG